MLEGVCVRSREMVQMEEEMTDDEGKQASVMWYQTALAARQTDSAELRISNFADIFGSARYRFNRLNI